MPASMMIDPEFLAMLVCPTSRQPLREATEAELSSINARIQAGAVRNRGGSPVAAVLTAGLTTTDGAWLYAVQEGIPILLAQDAIPTSEPPFAGPSVAG
jgi:uncharacterized protein